MTIAVISGNVFYQYHLATVPRVDLLPILTKEEKEENDYKVIYEQTGLTKEGYLRIEDDIDLILDNQISSMKNNELEEIQQELNNILEDNTTPINTPTAVLVKNTTLFFLSHLKLLKASIIF